MMLHVICTSHRLIVCKLKITSNFKLILPFYYMHVCMYTCIMMLHVILCTSHRLIVCKLKITSNFKLILPFYYHSMFMQHMKCVLYFKPMATIYVHVYACTRGCTQNLTGNLSSATVRNHNKLVVLSCYLHHIKVKY